MDPRFAKLLGTAASAPKNDAGVSVTGSKELPVLRRDHLGFSNNLKTKLD
jgi:hypothetical protein